MLRARRSFVFSIPCIVVTVPATTRPGSTLRPYRSEPGRAKRSNTARGEVKSARSSNLNRVKSWRTRNWGSSGFANTDLDLQLKKHGIHQLIVIGLIAHTCVEATVRFAFELGYEVTMVRDATTDYSDVEMHAALDVNIPNYAVAIVSTNEIVESIASL